MVAVVLCFRDKEHTICVSLFQTSSGDIGPQQPFHIEGGLLVLYVEGVKGCFSGSMDCVFLVQFVALSANSVGCLTVVTIIAENSVEEKRIQSPNIHITSTREVGKLQDAMQTLLRSMQVLMTVEGEAIAGLTERVEDESRLA